MQKAKRPYKSELSWTFGEINLFTSDNSVRLIRNHFTELCEVTRCHLNASTLEIVTLENIRTNRDVNRFPSSRGPNKQTRLLMRHKLFHEKRISHSIHSWYNDLVKSHFLVTLLERG